MSFKKVVYVDKNTPIMAENLNAIQDELLEHAEKLDGFEASSDNPMPLNENGVASPGRSKKYSRGDHIHPMPSMSLGIDPNDGLLYFYVNGNRTGNGIVIGGSVTIHHITYDLFHVISSNNFVSAQDGASYNTTLTPDSGWGNVSVTVTMDGHAVPNAYDAETGNVTVNSVSGDLVIEAIATRLPIDLLDVRWADHAITVGQDTNAYNAWSPHNMQYDDVHDKWLMLQSHANRHLDHTSSNWTLTVFNPYDPDDFTDVPLPRVFNGMGNLLVENGVWWLMCRWTTDVYRSADAGQTWEHFTADTELPRLFGVYKVGNKYFAGNDSNSEITYFVSDDLISWETRSFDSTLGYSILCETTFCEFQGRYWAFNRTNDAELGHPVILVSDDQGETWQLFSDQMLHGYRSTVSCLPFQNYIIVADIDRDGGYLYYSRFDGETVTQLNEWRVPESGLSQINDFHNVNLATNYQDTVVIEFMLGLPCYRDTSLYFDNKACDNVLLLGSTKSMPSLHFEYMQQSAFVSWMNQNAVTGLRDGTTYRWRFASNKLYLQQQVEGVWTDITDSDFVDEIELPLNSMEISKPLAQSMFKSGANAIKPWNTNLVSPNVAYGNGYLRLMAMVYIGRHRYACVITRQTDLQVLFREDYDWTMTGLGETDTVNAVVGQDWQSELGLRKVINVSRNKTGAVSVPVGASGNQFALMTYVSPNDET